jgi:hypothetical protein
LLLVLVALDYIFNGASVTLGIYHETVEFGRALGRMVGYNGL